MKKKYSLVGVDSNAYAIMGYVERCMREVGMSQKQVDAYIDDATSDNYHHLVYVSCEMVDRCNCQRTVKQK